jgi:hypothetical protein
MKMAVGDLRNLLKRAERRAKIGLQQESSTAVTQEAVVISPGPRSRAAMILAIVADAFQIVVFPLFVAGAASPADDVLDLGMGSLLIHLLGWHWEFLPSFLAKLVPGVDLVPFSTMAVASVYRKNEADRGHGRRNPSDARDTG